MAGETLTHHHENLASQEMGELLADPDLFESEIQRVEDFANYSGAVEFLNAEDIRGEISDIYVVMAAERADKAEKTLARNIAKATKDGKAALAKQEQSWQFLGPLNKPAKMATRIGDAIGGRGFFRGAFSGMEKAASLATTRRPDGKRYFLPGSARADDLRPSNWTRTMFRNTKKRMIEADMRRKVKKLMPGANQSDVDYMLRGEQQSSITGFDEAASQRSLYRSRRGLTRGTVRRGAKTIAHRARERGVPNPYEEGIEDLVALDAKHRNKSPSRIRETRHPRKSPSPNPERGGYRPSTPERRSIFDFQIDPVDGAVAEKIEQDFEDQRQE